MDGVGRILRILTWHVHGNYLYYLTQTPHEFYLPVGRTEHGYRGRAPGFPWPDNVHEVPAEQVRDLDLDCILFSPLSTILGINMNCCPMRNGG